MTTAIAVYSSDGCEGRCDAKCHEAAEPACDCICGGRLHGVGSSQTAIEMQTEDYFGSLEEADKWARANKIERPQVKVAGVGRRRSLSRLLAPHRAEERRQRALGIAPGQLPMFPAS